MNQCQDCKNKRCEFGHYFENLLFCYGAKPDFFQNEKCLFELYPSNLDLYANDILVVSFNTRNSSYLCYFNEIPVDHGLLKKYTEFVFASIGFDPRKIVKPKPKVTDVYSFLNKRQLSQMTIDVEKIKLLEEHNIICKGFRDDM